jgi:hypothetical protein
MDAEEQDQLLGLTAACLHMLRTSDGGGVHSDRGHYLSHTGGI